MSERTKYIVPSTPMHKHRKGCSLVRSLEKVVVHASNPSTQEDHELEVSPDYIMRPCLINKAK